METFIHESGDYMLILSDMASLVIQKRPGRRPRLEYNCVNKDRGADCAIHRSAQNAATIYARITGVRDVPFALIDANDPFDVAEFERQLRERDYRTRTTPALAVHCNEGGDAE